MPQKSTKHGLLRTKQRVGVQKGVAEVTIRNAFSKGIKHSELDEDSPLKRWVDGHVINKPAHVRLYGEHLYLYGGNNRLITVMTIPPDLLDEFKELWKERKGRRTKAMKGVL